MKVFEIPNWNVKRRKGRKRYNPYVFAEQRVAMLSSALNTKRTIAVNIQIMKTFVKIREYAITHKNLSQRLQENLP